MTTRESLGHIETNGSSVSFEAALVRLEEIVRRLEGGEVPLEESMRLFEDGVSLARRCSELLTAAERRIEVLVERDDGGFSLKPFEEPQGSGNQ